MTDPEQYLHSRKAYKWLVVLTGAAVIGIGVVRNTRGKIAGYFSALRIVDGEVKRYVFLLSALRYLVYALQFFLMLRVCGVTAEPLELTWAIFLNYLVVTIIPSVMFSELLVRGTV